MLLQEDSCQRHPEKSPSHPGSRNVWQGETFREIQGGCRQRSQHHQPVQVTHCHCLVDVAVDYCSSGNMFGVRSTWEKLCRGGRTKKKILTLVLLRERFSHSGVCLTRVLGEKWPVKIQIEWIISRLQYEEVNNSFTTSDSMSLPSQQFRKWKKASAKLNMALVMMRFTPRERWVVDRNLIILGKYWNIV